MKSPVVDKILQRPDLITKAAFPPMSPAMLAKTEEQLGFALPETLRDVYLRVANGGIGPHFSGFIGGLGGFKSDGNDPRGHDIVAGYHLMHSEPDTFQWPAKLVTFFDWGCACRCAVDCTVPNGQVVYSDPSLFEPYYAEDDQDCDEDPVFEDVLPALVVDADNIDVWLQRWLDGTLDMGGDGPLWIPPDRDEMIKKRRGRRAPDD
jgi:SMI1 / KNR4 family (SUKH-1)